MFRLFFLYCAIFILGTIRSIAQEQYPVNYFISPVDFPITLSGTFAELRANHFHSGIDIRTQGKEGKKIVACADGYISRIKISPYGFGKALYIAHPNGYTTVYAHLQKMNPAIDAWLKSEQYKLKKFDVDLFPPKDLLKVRQGEFICYSGNSGSSEGPHLHFEVRNTKTEMPVDPQLFGFPIKDFIRPVISSIRITPEDDDGTINGSSAPLIPELTGWGPAYRIKGKDTINIAGNFSLGVRVSDMQNGSENKNGICRFSVYIDSLLSFDWKAETFSFSETRYINSFIDYGYYVKTGQRYMTTRIAPNNLLSMYKTSVNNGIFTAIPDSTYQVKIVVSDANKNESVLRFAVNGRKKSYTEKGKTNNKLIFSYLKNNTFTKDGLTVVIPGKCLYEDMVFTHSISASRKNTCSAVYQIHNPETPLHDYIEVSITVDSAFRKLGEKLLLARLRQGKSPVAIRGKYMNGILKASIREFGQYTVMADTLPPVIKQLNISEGKTVTSQQTIRISISDDFSGIDTYSASLNGMWILMDYDAKNNLIEYQRDDRLLKGENKFELIVKDSCGNASTLKTTIFD